MIALFAFLGPQTSTVFDMIQKTNAISAELPLLRADIVTLTARTGFGEIKSSDDIDNALRLAYASSAREYYDKVKDIVDGKETILSLYQTYDLIGAFLGQLLDNPKVDKCAIRVLAVSQNIEDLSSGGIDVTPYESNQYRLREIQNENPNRTAKMHGGVMRIYNIPEASRPRINESEIVSLKVRGSAAGLETQWKSMAGLGYRLASSMELEAAKRNVRPGKF